MKYGHLCLVNMVRIDEKRRVRDRRQQAACAVWSAKCSDFEHYEHDFSFHPYYTEQNALRQLALFANLSMLFWANWREIGGIKLNVRDF